MMTRRRLNPRMAARPKFKGLPIPYVQYLRQDGSPDFRVIDEEKKLRVIKRRLCGLCGERLEGLVALVGGPLCVENRLWAEPPFHVDCAHDAMQLCPYLCRGKDHFHGQLPTARIPDEHVLVTDASISEDRPDRMAIYITRSYTFDGKYVHGGPAVRFEWYGPDGKRLEGPRV